MLLRSLITLLALLPATIALRMSSIEVPAAVMNGSQVTLVCNYDLQKDQLYSVKWYKNYVEFYRYQPGDQQQWTASNSGNQQQQQQEIQNSRYEFELDGINLNLQKSNATHVYLRQTNLASEGTYKCEVSADLPSFATISMERQMRVYVLPKQKLAISIADNSVANLTLEPQPKAGLLLHNINDLINLTCVSGPSRPPAKLTWLINDVPLARSSKWLSEPARPPPSSSGDQISESRLTLTFRLQATHLLRRNKSSTQSNLEQRNVPGQLLKLRCLAHMSVEFSSQTSIRVSGARATAEAATRRRQQQQQNARPLPMPESLVESAPQPQQSDSSALGQPAAHTDYPIYRWPRPLNGRTSGRRSHQAPSDGQVTGETSLEPAEMGELELARLQQQHNWPVVGSRSNLIVWSSKQLKAQAELVDQVLKLARPNELETPIIEAKSELSESAEVDSMEWPPAGDEGTPQSGAPEWESKFSQLSPAEADEEPEGGGWSALSKATSTRQPEKESRDYELNDEVEFMCRPRIAKSDAAAARRVRTQWSINGREIQTLKVNAFDGDRFYSSGSSSTTARRSAHQRGNSERSPVGPSISISSGEPQSADGGEQMLPSSRRNNTNSGDSSLWLEFTSSLFQVKELNLKCRTVVEQPLIEFESQILVSVPSSHYIQVDQQHMRASQHRHRASVLRGTSGQGNGWQRSNYSRNRLQSSSGARSLPLPSSLGLYLFLLILLPQCYFS